MTTPISFPIAKLLTAKSFEERTKSYNQDGKLVTVSMVIRRLNPDKIYYPAPTIAEVLMWLYEKHGIWIYSSDNSARLGFIYQIQRLKILGESNFSSELKYDSPIEAYEAAIEYCLTNLI